MKISNGYRKTVYRIGLPFKSCIWIQRFDKDYLGGGISTQFILFGKPWRKTIKLKE